MKAFLILEDGHVITVTSIGAAREVISEIVFNTSMTGYLEVLTDPSYAGHAVCMTYPLIGNYGICYEDQESRKPWIDAIIPRVIAYTTGKVVEKVTCHEKEVLEGKGPKVALMDFGAKRNIARSLTFGNLDRRRFTAVPLLKILSEKCGVFRAQCEKDETKQQSCRHCL